MATKLDLADAQLLGYAHGKREPGILGLIGSMGLTKSEWIKLKDRYTLSHLTSSEMLEIDDYFKLTLSERL